MFPTQTWALAGYQELTSAQLLGDQWIELCFDLASGQNVIQDLVVPETGGGYVYREAKLVGSPTHNRFIYWRTTNDILELVEISTETVLEGSQVRIRFTNSPILNNISIIELSDSIVIMVATLNSVHRLHLPHPKTTSKSVLQELNNEMLFTSSNYHIISNTSSNSQHPICCTFWRDGVFTKSALSFPDSSLLVVQFNIETEQTTTYDIKQIGIIGRIWSRMPNLLARTNANDYANAIFICEPYKHEETNDVLLFSLCRDLKIRVFSTVSKESVCTYPLISQASFTQSFSNPTGEPPLMKMFGPHLVIYINEGASEFVILTHVYEDETHSLKEKLTYQAPHWFEKMIDFRLSDTKLWCLGLTSETKSLLSYVDFRDPIEEIDDEFEGMWESVTMTEDLEISVIKNYVAEIFWRSRFSVNAVQKALFGFARPTAIKENDMGSLEKLAFTTIVDQNQSEAWAKFYNYCVQSQESFNKSIGLVVGQDEHVVSIIKRSNISFVCPLFGNNDPKLQEGPYRGIEFSFSIESIFEPLSYVSELIDEDTYRRFDEKLSEDLQNCSIHIEELVSTLEETNEIDFKKLHFDHPNLIESNIDHICQQLDLTTYSREYGKRVLLMNESKIQSDHRPLESNCGISLTFEMFKRLANARLFLARDLLVYIQLMPVYFKSVESPQANQLKYLYMDLYKTGKIRDLLDCLRCYEILVWIADSPIKSVRPVMINPEIVNFIADKFKFFKKVSKPFERSQYSGNESALYQNLFMNFLINGGVNFSKADQIENQQTVSNSLYITEIGLNLCKLLWPKSNHLCLSEYLFTHRLEDHLDKYLNLCEGWIPDCETDRHFMKASNCLLQKRPLQAVDIFNRLWLTVDNTNLPGLFIDSDKEDYSSSAESNTITSPKVIYRYYSKLIQLFQLYNDPLCLVSLIGHCMSLLNSDADSEQKNWINCFRAKLFQYHLELENPDEAYHTMVLTTDPSLRVNCLRKFIIHHCEKEQWSTLLSYPFIDIKDEFIEILKQKADNSDLSKLNDEKFYKTTFYDLLFASYVSYEEFKQAAQIMYNYAQRLAYEVPGIVSVRKQADCLLIALNSLRSVEPSKAFIESGTLHSSNEGRTSVFKRAYDSEADTTTSSEMDDETKHVTQTTPSLICCKDLKLRYELIRARLKLLERDQTANAIALSPLKEEETVSQLVASSMFPIAIDLALLFKTPLEPILEGLTGKFIFIMQLSTVDIAMHQNLNKDLYDIFTGSYSNIDTYNYIANSTNSCVDKLWRLIDYYLVCYDGISHRYSSDTFSNTFNGTTVLMKVVANKLLSAGYDVPTSLKRMYMSKNSAELLKLLIKYDKLIDAAELTIEIIDRILEHTSCFGPTSPFSSSDAPPVYLPTHLIILLISYLSEDVTNKPNMEMANILTKRIDKFRSSIKAFSLPIAN